MPVAKKDLPAAIQAENADNVSTGEAISDTEARDQYIERMRLRKAPALRFEPGQTMRGTVIGLGMGESGFGEYPIVKYRLSTGEIYSVHAFHTLLRNRLADLKTDIGSEHWVTYIGKATKNKATDEERAAGRDQYHDYDVEDVNAEKEKTEGVAEGFHF